MLALNLRFRKFRFLSWNPLRVRHTWSGTNEGSPGGNHMSMKVTQVLKTGVDFQSGDDSHSRILFRS